MRLIKGRSGGGAGSLQITGSDLEIARLMSSDPTSVYSAQDSFTTSSWSSTAYQEATILRIKSSAPALATLAGKTISSVIVTLYRTGGYMAENGTVFFKRILQTIVPAQLTWNVYSTGNAWQLAGALGGSDVDNSLNVVGAVGLTDTVTSMFTISTSGMITLLTNWVSGAYANNGMILYPENFSDYHTWSGPTGANPPVITVTYS